MVNVTTTKFVTFLLLSYQILHDLSSTSTSELRSQFPDSPSPGASGSHLKTPSALKTRGGRAHGRPVSGLNSKRRGYQRRGSNWVGLVVLTFFEEPF